MCAVRDLCVSRKKGLKAVCLKGNDLFMVGPQAIQQGESHQGPYVPQQNITSGTAFILLNTDLFVATAYIDLHV